MPKKPDSDKMKIRGVKGTETPETIQRAGAVSEVEKTQKTAPVAGVRAASALGKTRGVQALTAAQREAVFTMVHEEADRLFGKSGLSKKQRDVVEAAVKMAIDSVLLEEDDDDKKKTTPGRAKNKE